MTPAGMPSPIVGKITAALEQGLGAKT
jgi:hypothetical protein